MNDYERIARVIRYLDAHHADQPDLAALARHAGLSSHHFHRLFSAWAGITPKDFLQCLTLEHAKAMLACGQNVLDAALTAGLSGPGRLHDLCVSLDAASPGELKAGGADTEIAAGMAYSPFGACLLAEGPRGICFLAFPASGRLDPWEDLRRDWPNARIRRSDDHATRLARRVFALRGAMPAGSPLRAYVRGTPFQVRVWRSLLRIPPGALVSYGALAAAIGSPKAARAVGTAVGSNPLAYLIPCHRVIRATGAIGNYRWGPERKRSILAWEAARYSA